MFPLFPLFFANGNKTGTAETIDTAKFFLNIIYNVPLFPLKLYIPPILLCAALCLCLQVQYFGQAVVKFWSSISQKTITDYHKLQEARSAKPLLYQRL